jgi:RNA polymerase sigma-70 factor (ECF subfamily)
MPAEAAQTEPDEIHALVEQARRGDLPAFETLMRRHERLVMMTALRLLNGNLADAQDAAQTVFLRMHRYLGEFRGGTNFAAWLYRMTVNVCHDLNRKAKNRAEVSISTSDDLHTAPAPPDGAIDDARRRRMLSDGLAVLPEKERAAIVLRDIEGLRTREVAEILGSSEATVRSQISSGRRKIREFVLKIQGRRK